MNPKYPIFIPSKGRWDSRLTARALDHIGVPYRVVIEPEEASDYRAVIPAEQIIVAPENFSQRGQGSIPVRNFIWDLAISEGSRRHWIIDDNVVRFYRMNLNRRIPVGCGTVFRCAEDFTDRYTNIAFSGFNNIAFAPDRSPNIAPFILNWRVYSITLIDNDLPYRWRGRYNEDTDICLRALKGGFCTVVFNAFLADKATTMKMKGGNTDTVYNTGDERLAFAESLAEQHPECVRVVRRFNRWHHDVDYSHFKSNRLIRRASCEVPQGVNNYGMKLVRVSDMFVAPPAKRGAQGE